MFDLFYTDVGDGSNGNSDGEPNGYDSLFGYIGDPGREPGNRADLPVGTGRRSDQRCSRQHVYDNGGGYLFGDRDQQYGLFSDLGRATIHLSPAPVANVSLSGPLSFARATA